MSLLRRHRILQDDVRRVLAHLKAHKKITSNDVISRPRVKGGHERVPWALPQVPLAASWEKKELKPGPNNVALLYTEERQTWKQVVPEEQVEKWCRNALMDPKSKMPLGRDSAYHHVQSLTVGISRRALYKFLEKQSVLQLTRNIPDESPKGGEELQKRGICEMDLIEGKGRDVLEILGPYDNWYWLSLIDVLTGYGLVATIRKKAPKVVAPKLREMLDVLEHKLGTKVRKISADHGREFFRDVRKLCKRRKILLKQVSRGSRVEKFNQDFQRNFYRLLRLRRGNFSSLEDQALELTNNTKNKWTKKTPNECLKASDAELSLLYNKGRAKNEPPKGKHPKIGDKARHLVKLRKNIKPILDIKGQARVYKTYHGRHFTKQIYTIKDIRNPPVFGPRERNPKPTLYFLHGRWFHRDQLLLVSGTDAETERQVKARSKKGV